MGIAKIWNGLPYRKRLTIAALVFLVFSRIYFTGEVDWLIIISGMPLNLYIDSWYINGPYSAMVVSVGEAEAQQIASRMLDVGFLVQAYLWGLIIDVAIWLRRKWVSQNRKSS
jgi:hypothetical protein